MSNAFWGNFMRFFEPKIITAGILGLSSIWTTGCARVVFFYDKTLQSASQALMDFKRAVIYLKNC